MLFYTHNPLKFAFSQDKRDFKNFISSKSEFKDIKKPIFVLLGVPFDSTTTYRPGARFGPSAVREASYNFENYNLNWDCSIDSFFFDIGNVEVSPGNFKKTCRKVQETVSDLLSLKVIPIIIGGDHSISYAIAKALKSYNIFNELTIVHFDAHMDIIDLYMGEKFSHATVIRRIFELDPGRIIQVGVRSASYEEKEFVDKMKIEYHTSLELNEDTSNIENTLSSLEGPLYVSIDMDVFDPSDAPSVGNPIPCGINSHQMERLLGILSQKQVIALDVVEVAADRIGDSTSINAAKLILDFLCVQGKFVKTL